MPEPLSKNRAESRNGIVPHTIALALLITCVLPSAHAQNSPAVHTNTGTLVHKSGNPVLADQIDEILSDEGNSSKLTQETPLTGMQLSIDNAHKNTTSALNKFASQIDNLLGEDVTSDEESGTSATLRFDFNDPANDDFSTRAKIKLRLILPRSEEKLRLMLDVDGDDSETPAEGFTQDDSEQDLSFAFRFIRNFTEKTRFNVDLGARRFDQRFQTFVRFRLSNKNHVEDGWSYNLNNDLRFYYTSGYTNRSSFDLFRNLNGDNSMIFRASSSIKWADIQDGARIDQSVGFYKSFGFRSLLALEVIAGYTTSPVDQAPHYEGHTARLRYRKNFYRPWFHYEIWPSVSWLTEDNNDPTLGGLVRVEIQFGKDKR